MLELGSGGGNNASHLKKHFKMTLVDLAPGMLRISRKLNPECVHRRGDMRTVRLGREFDAVFIHDAIDYMLTLEDLGRAIQTAFIHCRPGGVALFVPDDTRERFRPSSSHGGTDSGHKGLRYLEWTFDPDPRDTTCVLYMSYLLREGNRVRQAQLDEHLCGLFSEQDWMTTLGAAGLKPCARSSRRQSSRSFVGSRDHQASRWSRGGGRPPFSPYHTMMPFQMTS